MTVPSILGKNPDKQCVNSGVKDRYGCAYWVAIQINQGYDREALIEGVKLDSPHIKAWGNFEELIEDALEELKNDYIPSWCQAKN